MGALIRPARSLRANLVFACAVLGAIAVTAAAAPSAHALGTKDFAFNTGGSPTGSKPESKLFFAHGSWFGVLWSNAAAAYRIHRLENDAWLDTGVAVDTSGSSRADTLYQASNDTLYVSTHPFTDSGHGASQKPSSTGAEVGKYAWDATNRRFVLATVAKHINAFKSETFVIERDSTGTLWATFTTGNKIWVTHSASGDTDAGWIAPYVVPGAADLDSDDTASIIHFAGDKIGVAWSNQKTGQLLFSVHADGAGDGAWATEVVPTGWTPDDHINLKAASDGRVFMATKTSESQTNPLVLLEVRGAGGGWSGTVFGTAKDSNTRAIVLLDEQNGTVHMYATCPAAGQASGQSGGDICEKTTSMAAPSFAVGNGPSFISDSTVSASAANMNDATSTRGALHGHVERRPDGLDMELRRRRHLGGAQPRPRLPGARHLYGRTDRQQRFGQRIDVREGDGHGERPGHRVAGRRAIERDAGTRCEDLQRQPPRSGRPAEGQEGLTEDGPLLRLGQARAADQGQEGQDRQVRARDAQPPHGLARARARPL
jgi:hypothetical protein